MDWYTRSKEVIRWNSSLLLLLLLLTLCQNLQMYAICQVSCTHSERFADLLL